MNSITELAKFLGKNITLALIIIGIIVCFFKPNKDYPTQATNNYYDTTISVPLNTKNKLSDIYQKAIINDSDGYTNIRSTPSINKKPIGVIKEFEIFWFKESSSNWWKVKTENGKKGYMHNSRINPIKK